MALLPLLSITWLTLAAPAGPVRAGACAPFHGAGRPRRAIHQRAYEKAPEMAIINEIAIPVGQDIELVLHGRVPGGGQAGPRGSRGAASKRRWPWRRPLRLSHVVSDLGSCSRVTGVAGTATAPPSWRFSWGGCGPSARCCRVQRYHIRRHRKLTAPRRRGSSLTASKRRCNCRPRAHASRRWLTRARSSQTRPASQAKPPRPRVGGPIAPTQRPHQVARDELDPLTQDCAGGAERLRAPRPLARLQRQSIRRDHVLNANHALQVRWRTGGDDGAAQCAPERRGERPIAALLLRDWHFCQYFPWGARCRRPLLSRRLARPWYLDRAYRLLAPHRRADRCARTQHHQHHDRFLACPSLPMAQQRGPRACATGGLGAL